NSGGSGVGGRSEVSGAGRHRSAGVGRWPDGPARTSWGCAPSTPVGGERLGMGRGRFGDKRDSPELGKAAICLGDGCTRRIRRVNQLHVVIAAWIKAAGA